MSSHTNMRAGFNTDEAASRAQRQRLPKVSICTVTYNRASFLELLQNHILTQSYPRHLLEWVILDDSDDGAPWFEADPNSGLKIRHERLGTKLTLGRKRNLSHELCCGEIIVYMDDDDYYPPSRIAHAVESLQDSEALMAGCSRLPILFLPEKELWIAGPYGNNHATAGTFAFKRQLLSQTRYEDDKAFAEEKSFLKNFTVPMVQLDPEKTIICICHDRNTFDKRRLKANGENRIFRKSDEPACRRALNRLGVTLPNYEAQLSASPRQSVITKAPKSLREPPRIHVVITLYNGESYIVDCLESIRRQKSCDFMVTIVDDNSDDSSWELAEQWSAKDSRFQLLRNPINQGPLLSTLRGINATIARPDDVIACIDCDDQLVGHDSLALVADAYAQTDCWLTYGSFMTSRGERRGVAYDRRTIRDNLFRVAPWRASHLRTFRRDLWSHVNDADLRDEQGHYLRAAIDLACMIPMLELAGHRQCFIPDTLYLYNVENPSSISHTIHDKQHSGSALIKTRPRYTPLTGLVMTTGSPICE